MQHQIYQKKVKTARLIHESELRFHNSLTSVQSVQGMLKLHFFIHCTGVKREAIYQGATPSAKQAGNTTAHGFDQN